MDAAEVINKYYSQGSLALQILTVHSRAVAGKAAGLATQLGFSGQEITFIREASILHDIGIFFTNAPDIGCFGELPYICHGFKGHDLLLAEGLPRHALVCERHTGAGLTLADVRGFGGILPDRPMVPVSDSEILIAYCDKFFSKNPERLGEERTYEDAYESLLKFGVQKAETFHAWHVRFNP